MTRRKTQVRSEESWLQSLLRRLVRSPDDAVSKNATSCRATSERSRRRWVAPPPRAQGESLGM